MEKQIASVVCGMRDIRNAFIICLLSNVRSTQHKKIKKTPDMFECSSLGFKQFSFISYFVESEYDGTVTGLFLFQFHANFTSIDNTNDFIFSSDPFEIVRLIPFVFCCCFFLYIFFLQFQRMLTSWNFVSAFQILVYRKSLFELPFSWNHLKKFSTLTADMDD